MLKRPQKKGLGNPMPSLYVPAAWFLLLCPFLQEYLQDSLHVYDRPSALNDCRTVIVARSYSTFKGSQK